MHGHYQCVSFRAIHVTYNMLSLRRQKSEISTKCWIFSDIARVHFPAQPVSYYCFFNKSSWPEVSDLYANDRIGLDQSLARQKKLYFLGFYIHSCKLSFPWSNRHCRCHQQSVSSTFSFPSTRSTSTYFFAINEISNVLVEHDTLLWSSDKYILLILAFTNSKP